MGSHLQHALIRNVDAGARELSDGLDHAPPRPNHRPNLGRLNLRVKSGQSQRSSTQDKGRMRGDVMWHELGLPWCLSQAVTSSSADFMTAVLLPAQWSVHASTRYVQRAPQTVMPSSPTNTRVFKALSSDVLRPRTAELNTPKMHCERLLNLLHAPTTNAHTHRLAQHSGRVCRQRAPGCG